jgi:hypothetical protein
MLYNSQDQTHSTKGSYVMVVAPSGSGLLHKSDGIGSSLFGDAGRDRALITAAAL